MRLGEISFCNHFGFNIKSDEFKNAILKDIESVFKQKIIQKHYDRFSESSLKTLNTNPYVMSLKSNGNPYFLYLTRYNGVNQCIFIDKKIQQGYLYPRMVIVKLWFDNALFNNTLFDGEMVKDSSNNWIFLIKDIIGDCGKDMMSVNLIRRINRCYEIFENMYVQDNDQNVCHFQIKKFFHYHEYDKMINEFIPMLSYSIRGISFSPLFLKFKDILFNFDDSLVKKVQRIKCKETENNALFLGSSSRDSLSSQESFTIQEPIKETYVEEVMLLQKTNQPDIYDVFLQSKEHVGHACVNNIQTSKLLRSCFMNKSLLEKLKFKCSYNSKFAKWNPVEQICV